ncbi:MAG: 4Fe-4S binding protein [Parahaliea sp.]
MVRELRNQKPHWLIPLLLVLLSTSVNSSPVSMLEVKNIFADAESADTLSGEKPVIAVRNSAGLALGFIGRSLELAPIPGYSGKPIDLLVALDTKGHIIAVHIRNHEEPILVIGLSEQDLHRFLEQFRGGTYSDRFRVNASNRIGYVGIDGISGATITAMVMTRSVALTAQRTWAEVQAQGANRTSVQAVPEPEPDPMDNLAAWQDKRVEIAITVIALSCLLVILFFQDWIAQRKKLFHGMRISFLVFTVLFFGFYCAAQLSVMNLLAFFHTLIGGFTWSSLLMEPVAFVIWSFVAISILLWGRGVYCGWLCPFGAAQDLISKLSKRLGIKNYEFPQMVHERLWAIKYILLISLIGLSLQSMGDAARLAETEPFKTVFVLHFERSAPFVIYALVILFISAINSKFYCKYLCSLGAGLGILTRFRTFDWLRRRNDCGTPCQACAADCQIAAIKPTGQIIDNECHYCLECQVTYWDDQRCPPLVKKRKKQERRQNQQNQKSQQIIASSSE